MTETELTRDEFRKQGLERDNESCVIPWCERDADEVHHIIERSLWDDGGYYLRNGASVCNPHHRYAEENHIPPQSFWRWIGVEPLTPSDLPADVNKWGEEFETPPWAEYRDNIKYPSTGHLPFSPEWDGSRVDHQELDEFVDVPLIVTIKQDGSNAMLVKDQDNPVRARNGTDAPHQSFDLLKQLYYEHNLYEELPEHIQVFGEWLYAKHSIHYGCACDSPCDDTGPSIGSHHGQQFEYGGRNEAYFQVFGVFDTRVNTWLGWPEVVDWAERLGFPTTPVVRETLDDVDGVPFESEHEIYDVLPELAARIVDSGHEGIVVRSKFPFHYDQFQNRVGKYVRDGHVDPDADHWKHTEVIQNELSD